MSIGKRIGDLRRGRNLTQEYVAQALDVSRQAVSKWENDQSVPDTNNLIALAGLFHVSVEYLATGEEGGLAARQEGEDLRRKDLSATLGNTTVFLYLLPVILNILGYLTGVFDDMMTIPIGSRGDRLGIWLGYGDSVTAILLLVLEVLSVIAAIVLTVVSVKLGREEQK